MGRKLARACWEEIKQRATKKEARDGWEEERKQEERGWRLEEFEGIRERRQISGELLWKTERRVQREYRRRKTAESRYNRWYC